MNKLLVVVGLSVLAAFSASAQNDIKQFDDEAKRELYKELTLELRCPKCQNQNIADSDAVVAKDLRDKVYELVQKGEQKQQVVDYMIDRYGYFVHYKPPMTLGTIMLWLLPALFLMAGALVVWLRQRRQAAVKTMWQASDEAKLQQLIAEIEKE